MGRPALAAAAAVEQSVADLAEVLAREILPAGFVRVETIDGHPLKPHGGERSGEALPYVY